MWSVAVEYFRVFRRGLFVPDGASNVELDFLRATMAPDMDVGTVRGFDKLVRNWEVFTHAFQDVHVQLGRLDQIAGNSLVATTTTSITVTRSSLSNMFPHLMSDRFDQGKGGERSRIAARLLDQRIVMRGSSGAAIAL